MGPSLKTGFVVGPKIQQMNAHSTRLKLSSQEFLFNYIEIVLFLKRHYFLKMFSSHISVHNRI